MGHGSSLSVVNMLLAIKATLFMLCNGSSKGLIQTNASEKIDPQKRYMLYTYIIKHNVYNVMF